MTWAAVAIGGASLGAAAISTFAGKKSSTASQVPLETPEQRNARAGLLGFAKTGTYGDYTAGTPYGGSLGNFALTNLEKSGLNTVRNNLTSGPGDLFKTGSSSLMDLLNTEKFNPLNQTGMIQGLTGAIDYNTKLASDAARRSAGYTGNLYSTDAIRSLGNVEAQGANTKATTLAGLYQNYIGQKLSAIPEAFSAQAQLNQSNEQKLQDAFTYGSLPRTLSNASDAAQYAEFQRQQQEKQGQISALSSAAGDSSNFGVPNVSVPQEDPWAKIAGLMAQFGGSYLGKKAAA